MCVSLEISLIMLVQPKFLFYLLFPMDWIQKSFLQQELPAFLQWDPTHCKPVGQGFIFLGSVHVIKLICCTWQIGSACVRQAPISAGPQHCPNSVEYPATVISITTWQYSFSGWGEAGRECNWAGEWRMRSGRGGGEDSSPTWAAQQWVQRWGDPLPPAVVSIE